MRRLRLREFSWFIQAASKQHSWHLNIWFLTWSRTPQDTCSQQCQSCFSQKRTGKAAYDILNIFLKTSNDYQDNRNLWATTWNRREVRGMSLASGIPLSPKASAKSKMGGSRPEKPSGFRLGLSKEKMPIDTPGVLIINPVELQPRGRGESEMNQPSNDWSSLDSNWTQIICF